MTDSEALRQHRRDRFRKIYLPVIAPTLLMAIGGVVLFALAVTDTLDPQQIQVMAGCLVTVFVLLPLVIVLLLLDAVFVMAAFGSDSLEKWAQKPLDLLREYTEKGAALTKSASDQVAGPVIDARAQVARLGYLTLIQKLLGDARDEN
jgi:hypothetical protein